MSSIATEMGGNSDTHRGDRVSQAYERLRMLIVGGRLAPGTRIIETDVAERLGVSRTPVRSALQRLQQEGYIVGADSGHQSRLSVAPLTQQDARELFAIVAELEGLGALWAGGLDTPQRSALSSRLAQLNRALLAAGNMEEKDHQQVFELDMAVHRAVVMAGGGPRLLALHDAVKPQTERYVRLYVSAFIDQVATSVREHEDIVAAIDAGDGAAARDALRRNWSNAADRLCRVIESLGERGTW
jgi:DNA-binding GntR family transcriptional regulator